VLRLEHLGLKPEATAEGSQLKRAVGSFEVNLSSNVLVRLVQPAEWMIFIMVVVMGRCAADWGASCVESGTRRFRRILFCSPNSAFERNSG
jgi:hypothetical protein